MEDQEIKASISPDMRAHAAALDPQGMARRRFTRIGAGATGVILTLHSQPGMAAGSTLCSSPSGFMSMTSASNNPQNSCSYNRSHGYWKTHPQEWKSRAGIDPHALFGTVFRASGKYADMAGATLMQVVERSAAVKAIDHNNVAMQTVAAYLNARASSYAGLPSVLPETRVMEIWDEFVVNGYYTPSPDGTVWTGAQIAAYLESTFR